MHLTTISLFGRNQKKKEKVNILDLVYNLSDLSASEVMHNNKPIPSSFWIETYDETFDMLYIYWTVSSKCSTKLTSIALAKLLTHVRSSEGYSRKWDQLDVDHIEFKGTA